MVVPARGNDALTKDCLAKIFMPKLFLVEVIFRATYRKKVKHFKGTTVKAQLKYRFPPLYRVYTRNVIDLH